jgi:hypothetical protein
VAATQIDANNDATQIDANLCNVNGRDTP